MLQWEAMRNKYMDDGHSAEDAAQRSSSELISTTGINPYGSKYGQPVGIDGKLVAGATPLWDDSWEDALTQDAHYTDLSARISGGSKKTEILFLVGLSGRSGCIYLFRLQTLYIAY